MKLNIFKNEKRSTPAEIVSKAVSDVGNGVITGLENTISGSGDANKDATYFACKELIKNSISLMPPKVFRVNAKGERKRVYNNEVLDVLETPNQVLTRSNLMRGIVDDIFEKGDAFVLIKRNKQAGASQLVKLQWGSVTVKVDNPIAPSMVTYDVNGFGNISSDDMLHFWYLTENGYSGKSIKSYADVALETSLSSTNMARNYYKGGAQVSGYLNSATKLSEQQAKRIKTDFSARTKSNDTLLLEGALVEWKPITNNPKDSQINESRAYNSREMAMFFLVMQSKLGLGASQYKSIDDANRAFVGDAVLPFSLRLEEEFNRKIFRPSQIKRYILDFDEKALLDVDPLTKAQVYDKLTQIGAVSPNTTAKAMDLDIDPTPEGDRRYMLANYVPSEKMDDVYSTSEENQNNSNKSVDKDENNEQ